MRKLAIFLDPLLASAGLDRLLDRAEVVVIRGASFGVIVKREMDHFNIEK